MRNAVVFTRAGVPDSISRSLAAGAGAIAAGLRFIGRNWSCVTDDSCDAPAGFDIIFPGMLARAIGMGLEIPLVRQADVDAVLWLRDSERIRGFVGLFLIALLRVTEQH